MDEVKGLCQEHVKIFEEVEKILIYKSMDSEVIEQWVKQCVLSLDSLRELLRKRTLTTAQKQSILYTIARIESIKAKLDAIEKTGYGIVPDLKTDEIKHRVRWIDIHSAFNKRVRTSIITNLVHIDLSTFLKDASVLFCQQVKKILKDIRCAMKINTVLSCSFKKLSSDVNEDSQESIETKHFNTPNAEVVLGTSLSDWFVNHVLNKLLAEVEEFQEKDSGWTLNSIINNQINMNKFNPLRSGNSYLPLPPFKKMHALIFKTKIINALNGQYYLLCIQ